jgi:predicted RNA methylase
MHVLSMKRPGKRKRKSFKYIDIFAGCGGLALGMHIVGWRGLVAIEKDRMFEIKAGIKVSGNGKAPVLL